MSAPTYDAGSTPEILDSRDLIAWADWNRDDEDLDTEDRETLEAIDTLADAGIEDWIYGATLIRENYFIEYAQQLADDIGLTSGEVSWPYTCIDWEWAARELRYDYTTVEYLDVTYYVR